MKPETFDFLFHHPLLRTAWSYFKISVIAIFLGILIQNFLVETYRVPSNVMKPNLQTGDIILSLKFPFGLRIGRESEAIISGRPPRYGEMVIYIPTEDTHFNLCRRVVGLPGDIVEIKNHQVYLNEKALPFHAGTDPECGEETHINGSYTICVAPPYLEDTQPTAVPEGQVYVLPDLRSKYISPIENPLIPINAIRSRPTWVWLSIDPNRASAGVPNIHFSRILRGIQ